MKSLKINFKKDIITGNDIPIEKLRSELKAIKNKSYYLSEIAEYFYLKKYNKNILEILDDFYDIPKCPATNEFVSYKLTGSILFGKYANITHSEKINRYISENNEAHRRNSEKMKTERVGKGNPMYGLTPWNKGLTKDLDDRVLSASNKLTGLKHSEESKKNSQKVQKKEKFMDIQVINIQNILNN
jgi:hypothetical protein